MIKKSLNKFAKNFAEKVYKYFGSDSGNMLLMTSIIGTFASCLAQTGAIIFNKKYTDSQKTFMAPQELTEGCVTILSIFLITKPIQALAKKSVRTGKIITKDMANYLEKNNLADKRGKSNFNFSNFVNEKIKKIKSSDIYVKSTEQEKINLLSEHKKILENFDIFLDSTSAIASTIGGATSLAIVSPLLRNYTASKFQKASLKYFEEKALTEAEKPNNKTIKKTLVKPEYTNNVCKI